MPSDEEIRQRILDAAEQCLLESGLSARIHAAVAERAGISRPTLYKYVGDQHAILEALLHREVTRFFEAAAPLLTKGGTLRERFTDTVVFVVGYAREHPLLRKGLDEDPTAVLPWFTAGAAPLIERAVDFFGPHLTQAIDEGQLPEVDPRTIVEWAFRLSVSLVTTPSTLDIGAPDTVRAYLEVLLDIGIPAQAAEELPSA